MGKLQGLRKPVFQGPGGVCPPPLKVHERVSRGYLSDLAKEYDGAKVKGEVALVVAGCNPKFRREQGE